MYKVKMPPIENKYIVTEIMNEMEQKNGSYDEDDQQFANAGSHSNRNPVSISYSNKLLGIIQNDPNLVNLINSHPSNESKLKSLLASNEDALKRDLFDDPRILPDFLYDYFKVQSSPTPQFHSNPIEMPMHLSQIEGHDNQSQQSYHYVTESNEFNFAKLLVGPLLAAVVFFLVTNTPILFYLGKLPYIGNLLVNNKLITSLALIILLFMAGELLINMIGLLD